MDNRLLKNFFFILFLSAALMSFSQTFLDKAEVYYFNGKSAFQTGNYKSAESFFETALKFSAEIEIKYPDIRYMLGWTKFYLRKYDEAKEYLKYYADDPKVSLALKSIESGNIREDLHFKSLKIDSTVQSTESTSNKDLKIGLLYYVIVFFVILLIVMIMGFLTYFFIFKKYTFTTMQSVKNNVENIAEFEETSEEIPAIPVEEILEVKIDELEELWDEYEKMKKKMDIEDDENNENFAQINQRETLQAIETNLEEIDVNELLNEASTEEVNNEASTENVKTEDINMDIEDVLEEEEVHKTVKGENESEDIKDETISEEMENGEIKEVNDNIEIENNVEDKNIESFIQKEKMTSLDDIETIKPNIDVITKYNKIMSEPEGSIIVSNVKGLESLDKIDEEVKKKGGSFSKGDLHNIFKEIFAEKNRDSLMIE
ncbi:hypothetical protein X275_01720 [Marinitoga sp. 1197]|uniref:tetratricopeptide repeat protein n=1 Tax=Marinitoga sp. 1197 TaxID=1428449 RepID=UPI0006412F27|nr:hypothetical protein [Marinitoga sp. 1197]KLO23817.1 hypothetical protein X275_01720 [Marinitoga sp. 1197]